jgi:hypothetical protein
LWKSLYSLFDYLVNFPPTAIFKSWKRINKPIHLWSWTCFQVILIVQHHLHTSWCNFSPFLPQKTWNSLSNRLFIREYFLLILSPPEKPWPWSTLNFMLDLFPRHSMISISPTLEAKQLHQYYFLTSKKRLAIKDLMVTS